VVRGPVSDEMAVQKAVTRALPGSDLAAWRAHLARAEVAVVTLTVTEAAYRVDPDDAAAVRRGAEPVTVPGKLVAGLHARRVAGAGPLAVVSCDNLPANGSVTARAVLDFAEAADPALVTWIHDH